MEDSAEKGDRIGNREREEGGGDWIKRGNSECTDGA